MKKENGKRMDGLSFVELEEEIKKSEEYTRRLKDELTNRKIELFIEKHEKILSWIVAEFQITNCCQLSAKQAVTFLINDKKYLCNFQQSGIIFIEIDFNKWLGYLYDKESKKFYCHYHGSTSIRQEHDMFLKNNPNLFKSIETVETKKLEIFKKCEEYEDLIFETNYLLCLTFLLCAKKTFPRDIAKLIAQKIFFSFFLLS